MMQRMAVGIRASRRRKAVAVKERELGSSPGGWIGRARVLMIFRISKNDTVKARTGRPVVSQAVDFPVQSRERAGATCQMRKPIHALMPRTSELTITRVTPRSATKAVHATKMAKAAVPRLICGMESGDTAGGSRGDILASGSDE